MNHPSHPSHPNHQNHRIAHFATASIIDLIDTDPLEFCDQATKRLNYGATVSEIAQAEADKYRSNCMTDTPWVKTVDASNLGIEVGGASVIVEARVAVIAAAIKEAFEYAQHHYNKSGASA